MRQAALVIVDRQSLDYNRQGLWVPAFAGTTAIVVRLRLNDFNARHRFSI